jgi:hypothetical protein
MVFYWYYDVPVMYDMRAVMKAYASDADFSQWNAICQKAVPYHRMSLKWMTIYTPLECSFPLFSQDESLNVGVSMFVPQNNSVYQDVNGTFRYNATCSQFEWNRVLDWSRFGW